MVEIAFLSFLKHEQHEQVRYLPHPPTLDSFGLAMFKFTSCVTALLSSAFTDRGSVDTDLN